MMRPKQMKN